jgi:hypothetical protein
MQIKLDFKNITYIRIHFEEKYIIIQKFIFRKLFFNMDNKKNVKILLMLYQQHPCLYVTKSVEYHNRMKRDQALQIFVISIKN